MKKLVLIIALLSLFFSGYALEQVKVVVGDSVYVFPKITPSQSVEVMEAEEEVVECDLPVDSLSIGKMVWVPDSLIPDVDLLKKGQHKLVYDESKVDLNEMTIFKGDTIPMVLKDLKLGRYDRGLYNFLFMPKGMWSLGLTASYGKFSTDDLQLFDILSDVDISAHIFSIKPYVSYTFKNNVAAGLRLEYSNMQGDIHNLNLDIDEDMNFSLNDIMYRSESYSASLLLTQYIGLSRRGRFGVFNEVQLSFSGGTSDFNRPYNSVLRCTHTNFFDARLTYSPGLMVFVMKNVSCNLSFGVFGFYIRKEKQSVNGEYVGNRVNSGANFRFNIFNISFGLAVHI